MKINGNFACEVTGYKLSYNEPTGLRLAHVQIAVRCDAKKAKKLFGSEFADLAFGSLQTIGGEEGNPASRTTRFGYKSMKPSVVCTPHNLSIEDRNGLIVQPTVVKIEPSDSVVPSVDVTIELPVEIMGRQDLAGYLAMCWKNTVNVTLEEREPELPLAVVGGEVV